MNRYTIQKFPESRIASIDICEIGKKKHHVAAMLEFDVTDSRKKIRSFNKSNSQKISFNAWLIGVVGYTLKRHESLSSFLVGKKKQIIFDDINVSLLVEKEVNGKKVPMPLLIEKANEKSIAAITQQIDEAKKLSLSGKEIVIQRKTQKWEKLYYQLPAVFRKLFWRYLMKNPKLAFSKMGNVAFTSVGMMGKVNGWFIPIAIHPICFGVGSVIKKPAVVADQITIREMLQMTVLIDHDVVDGADMARFIAELSTNIENGWGLSMER